MSAVDTAITELQAAKATIDPQVVGLHDFSDIPLQPTTREAVAQAITNYERRQSLIGAAISALVALNTDGYPTVVPQSLNETEFEDLQGQLKAIEAAFAQFAEVPVAVALDPTAGASVPK